MTNRLEELKQIWQELDYAQRRSLEIRTGIPGLLRRRPRRKSSSRRTASA